MDASGSYYDELRLQTSPVTLASCKSYCDTYPSCMGVNDYNGRDNDGVSINPSYAGCEPNCCVMAFGDGTLPTASNYPSAAGWVVSHSNPGTGTPTQTDASSNPNAVNSVTCYAKD